jgi:hypothetical protein
MSDLFWLSDEQMARLKPFFPKSSDFSYPLGTHQSYRRISLAKALA